MELIQTLKSANRLTKLLASGIAAGVLYTLVGFLVLPPIVKGVATKKLSAQLHRKVTIDSLRLNPYTLSMTLKGLTISELESADRFIALDELYVNVQANSLFKKALMISDLQIIGPYVKIIRTPEDRYNFSDLLPPPEDAAKQQTQDQAPRLCIENFILSGGRVDVTDNKYAKHHEINSIYVALARVSSLKEDVNAWIQPQFAAVVNGSLISAVAISRPFHPMHDTLIDAVISRLDIPYYVAYLPVPLNFKIQSGTLDMITRIGYTLPSAGQPSIDIKGKLSLSAVELLDGNAADLLKLPKLELAITSLNPPAKRLHLAKVLVQSAEINVRRNPNGKINWQELLPPAAARPAATDQETPQAAEQPFALALDDLVVAAAKVSFADHQSVPAFQTILDPLWLTGQHLSTDPRSGATVQLSAQSEAGEQFQVNGEFTLEPLAVTGNLEMAGVPARKYAPYYARRLQFDVADASLDFSTDYRVTGSGRRPEVKLSGMAAALRSLKLKLKDAPEAFLDIPALAIKQGALDLQRRELQIQELSTQDGMARGQRLSNGQIDLTSLFPAATPAADTPAPGADSSPQAPWRVMLGKGVVTNYTFKAADQMVSSPVSVTLDQFNATIENFSTAPDTKINVDLTSRLNEQGTASFQGTISIDPLFADLHLKLEQVDLTPIQAYVPEKVKLSLTSGNLSADGNLVVGVSKDQGLNATYLGSGALAGVASLDRLMNSDFLKWKNLEMKGIDAGTQPPRLSIQQVTLSDFYSRIAISPEGKINALEVFKEDGAKPQPQAPPGAPAHPAATARATPTTTAPPPPRAGAPQPRKASGATSAAPAPARQAAPAPPQAKPAPSGQGAPAGPVIKIATVMLEGGHIDFSDQHIKPRFATNMLDIHGAILGLSSEKNALADIKLKGRLNNNSPLEITGKIGGSGDQLSADIHINFKDIDMTRMNPYARKYVGYALEKGNLHLDLRYQVVQKKLNSENNVVVDKLTLGERVESPDATTLPVKFAISLLQDSNGQIRLGIPVTGNVDDPKFSLRQVIFSAIGNFIMKALTSPFALLGAALGSSEELSTIEFAEGSRVINEAAEKKLETLGKALQERPKLELDIEGRADPEKDSEALRQELFTRKLKTQKLKEMVKKGTAQAALEQVTVAPDEYEKYLKAAYHAEFPKGLIKGLWTKDPPPEEMKKALLATVKVSDDDLSQLAQERAMAVKNQLINAARLDARRIFLVEPKTAAPAEKTATSGNRVNLKLK